MKSLKFLIIFAVLFFMNLPVLADVMPYYTGAISKQTIGFLQVPKVSACICTRAMILKSWIL